MGLFITIFITYMCKRKKYIYFNILLAIREILLFDLHHQHVLLRYRRTNCFRNTSVGFVVMFNFFTKQIIESRELNTNILFIRFAINLVTNDLGLTRTLWFFLGFWLLNSFQSFFWFANFY